MRLYHAAGPGEPRLRIVFADRSFALGLPACPTFGDIADWVEEIACRHEASPLFVDIQWRAATPAPQRASLRGETFIRSLRDGAVRRNVACDRLHRLRPAKSALMPANKGDAIG
jgi:hypothetical protein